MNESIETVLTTAPEALRALAVQARDAGLVPERIEHDLAWVAGTEHGSGGGGGAIAIYQRGELGAYVPLRWRRNRLPLRFGELSLAAPSLCMVDLFGRMVVGDDARFGPAAAAAIAGLSLRHDIVSLESVPVSSPVWIALRSTPDPSFVFRERGRSRRRLVRLPSTSDAYFRRFTSKHRNNLARRERMLEKELGPVSVRLVTSPDEVDDLFDCAWGICSQTYHHRLLGRDLSRRNHSLRRNYRRYAERGWMRAYVLHAAERPIAYEIGLVQGRVFFGEMTAYDPAFAKYGPGFVLIARVIRDLVEGPRLEVFDFGEGDADYKDFFSTDAQEEGAAFLVRPRWYSRSIVFAERSLAEMSRLGVALLDRLGLKSSIKRLVRERWAR